MTQLVPDEAYIKERNKLIPYAELYADKRHRITFGGKNEEKEKASWSACFHAKMDELWRDRMKEQRKA